MDQPSTSGAWWLVRPRGRHARMHLGPTAPQIAGDGRLELPTPVSSRRVATDTRSQTPPGRTTVRTQDCHETASR